jgi:hypothetical protein
MGVSHYSLAGTRPLTDEELAEWEEAYAAVEAYFQALRLRNRLLVAEFVQQVLRRAVARHASEPAKSGRLLAMEETIARVAEWTEQLLDEPLEGGRLAARGRLALLLADMPGKWKGVFLAPPPWPARFAEAMKRSYLAAGPRFAELPMTPQRLDLNRFASGAAYWWETMDRLPTVRRMTLAVFLLLLLTTVWFVFFD